MSEPILWIVVVMAIAAAAVIGYYIGRGNVDRKRVDTLEAQIESQSEQMSRQQAEHETYRREVSEHFDKTATLFVDMAGSYKALFAHLSEGYETLSDKSSRKVLPDRPGALLDGPEGGEAYDATRIEPTLDAATPASSSGDKPAPASDKSATGTAVGKAADTSGESGRKAGKSDQSDQQAPLPPLEDSAAPGEEKSGKATPQSGDDAGSEAGKPAETARKDKVVKAAGEAEDGSEKDQSAKDPSSKDQSDTVASKGTTDRKTAG